MNIFPSDAVKDRKHGKQPAKMQKIFRRNRSNFFLLFVINTAFCLVCCSDPKIPQLQADLTKAKEDQARAEGELAQIKADNATAAASYQGMIVAQKAKIDSLQRQLKDATASIASLQMQLASNQAQQVNQNKEDQRLQSYGKAIEVLKGIRSRIAVGMSPADYLALIRDANADVSSDLELQGINISQFTVPKDWPATLGKDLPGSILISLQAYKDVLVLNAASAPEPLVPSSGDVQYILNVDLRDMINKWSLPILLKGKVQFFDVPFVDPDVGVIGKAKTATFDISELNTAKCDGCRLLLSDGGETIRQMLFTIASKATDSSVALLNPPATSDADASSLSAPATPR